MLKYLHLNTLDLAGAKGYTTTGVSLFLFSREYFLSYKISKSIFYFSVFQKITRYLKKFFKFTGGNKDEGKR